MMTLPTVSADFSYNRNNSTLSMTGQVFVSDSTTFMSYLEKYPDIKTVKLSGPGGSFEAGVNIGITISDLGLNTVVSGICDSSCAYIWLAGKVKMADVNAANILGLHMPAIYAGDSKKTKRYPTDELDVGYYIGYVLKNYGVALAITNMPNSSITNIDDAWLQNHSVNISMWDGNYLRGGK